MTTNIPIGSREILSYVSQRRRENDPRRLSDRFTDAYTKLFVAGYAVLVVFNLVGSDITPRPGFFVDVVEWLPLLLFAISWGIIRFATWQGPVLFSAPEMQWVISAPLPRAELIGVRLVRSLVIAGSVGAGGGVVIAGAAAIISGQATLGMFVASTLSIAALAVLATSLSWHVERSVRWSALVNRITPAAVLLGVVVGTAIGYGYSPAALWSGPWGWAAMPLVREAGGEAPGWLAATILLGVATVLAGTLAIRMAGVFSIEELWRRAEARSAAAAAMFFGDVRTVMHLARRERTRGLVRGRMIRIPRTHRPWLMIIYRDVITFRRNPAVIGRAVLFAGTALAAAIAAAARPILAVAAVMSLYLAASRLIEPIRFEAEQSDAHRILPWRWGPILVMHCVVPALLLTGLGWIAAAFATARGVIDLGAAATLILVAPFAAAAMIAPAAASAARRPFPVEFLITQQERGWFALFGWVVTGPVLAGVIADLGYGLLWQRIDRGVAAALPPIALFTVATTAFLIYLWNKQAPDR